MKPYTFTDPAVASCSGVLYGAALLETGPSVSTLLCVAAARGKSLLRHAHPARPRRPRIEQREQRTLDPSPGSSGAAAQRRSPDPYFRLMKYEECGVTRSQAEGSAGLGPRPALPGRRNPACLASCSFSLICVNNA